MFSNMRSGALIYVLHKQEVRVEVGEVISVSQPQPQYNVAYNNGLIQQPKTCVDVSIKVGEQTIDLQKLPSDQTIADCNGMVVSENKDSIINEVSAMAKISQSVIESVEHHNDIVSRCKSLLEELNPEVKREAERDKEIKDMKEQINGMMGMLSQLLNKKQEK